MPPTARAAAYDRAAGALAALDDAALTALLASADPVAAGIGGRAALLEAGGVPVFAKRVPLTADERRPGAPRSTADPFGLPPAFHYGVGEIGSPGFTAWRELAAHEATSAAVRSGTADAFPLLYHWRVLPETEAHRPADLADSARAVAYWGGAPGVRRRLAALESADASLVLFLERLPATVHDWLTDRVAEGGPALDRALETTERGLLAGLAQLDALQLRHFDGHFGNILTDGTRLCFTDFGLAGSPAWQQAPDEAAFVAAHAGYDRAYTLGHFTVWLLAAFGMTDAADRGAALRACAAGAAPPAVLPPAAARIVRRYAPLAAGIGDFTTAFRADRTAVYAPVPAGG